MQCCGVGIDRTDAARPLTRAGLAEAQGHVAAACASLGLDVVTEFVEEDAGDGRARVFTALALVYADLGELLADSPPDAV